MKNIVKKGYIILSIFFLIYLILPNPGFPEAIPNSYQSDEPGDIETPLRRAFYTNLTRQEVLNHYREQFLKSRFLGIFFPTYQLNYPPEEAQTLIRDQTRSTFLEEIVHPFRESLYVNGFKPDHPKDVIVVEGVKWEQKITVKIIPSNTAIRLTIGIVTIILLYILLNQWLISVRSLFKGSKK